MNKNCENSFYDITINDLMPLILKQWRKILFIGIIIAVAFGLYRFIPLYYTANSYHISPTNVEENEAKKKLLQESVEKLQSEVDLKETELAESIYYNLEPSMITTGIISFYIDTPIKDEALGYQKNLVSSYISYFDSGEIYNIIANQLNEYIKPNYLAQIVQAKTDYGTSPSSFNVYVMGSNKNQIDEILQLIKQEVYNKKSEVSSIVTAHSINLVSENITVISDEKVMEDQQFQIESFAALKLKLDEKKSELQNIEAQPITKKDALLAGLKFSLLGLLCGTALAMAYFSVVVIFSNKIKSRKQIINNYNIEVLGELYQEHKNNNKFDVFVSKLAGEPYGISKVEIYRIVANNIIAMSKSKKLLIVGCKDISDSRDIFDGISSCDILKNYEISCNVKSFSNSETLANILNYGSVIMMVKKNKTSLEELHNAIHIVESYKKDFVGVILV